MCKQTFFVKSFDGEKLERIFDMLLSHDTMCQKVDTYFKPKQYHEYEQSISHIFENNTKQWLVRLRCKNVYLINWTLC